MKLATFAQAVSELSNTVHLNISSKIVHLQQDISELERALQRSLQTGNFFCVLYVRIYILSLYKHCVYIHIHKDVRTSHQ